MSDYDKPLDLPTRATGGIMLITDQPNIVLSMLHDMTHYVLSDEGFTGFMKFMEAKYPKHVKHMAEDHPELDLHARSRDAVQQLLDQIHDYHDLSDGDELP